MAKAQITEEQLTSSIKGVGGGFSGLTMKRESPFRDSRESPPPRAAASLDVSSPSTVEALRHSEPAAVSAIEAQPVPRSATGKNLRVKKAEASYERVTVQMTPGMRDELDELARRLQRAKTSKDERITTNTVMRVGLQYLLDSFTLKSGDAPNNEDELYELVCRRLGGRA